MYVKNINDMCKHLILYSLRFGPPLPNEDSTLRPRVEIWPNLVKSLLEEIFMENIKLIFRRINLFLENKCCRKPLVCVRIHTYAHAHSSHTYACLGYAHAYLEYVHTTRVLESYEMKVFCI